MRVMNHSAQKKDGSYIHEEARTIRDESSRVLSQNDSLAQALGKDKPSTVHCMGFGPTPSQIFGPNSHPLGNRVQIEEIQRKLLELQAELEAKKLMKRKAMENKVVAEKKKRQASALRYLFQWQGEELQPNIAARMNFV
ncbi:hypothetical protein AHAS_Ahas13G0264200 [Arachis hypogaea]